MNSITKTQNSPRLLDQLRTAIRYKLYSYATEKAYVYWARYYIRSHNLRHPAEMSATQLRNTLASIWRGCSNGSDIAWTQ